MTEILHHLRSLDPVKSWVKYVKQPINWRRSSQPSTVWFVSWNRATPSHHPFLFGIFPYKPTILKTSIYGNPSITIDRSTCTGHEVLRVQLHHQHARTAAEASRASDRCKGTVFCCAAGCTLEFPDISKENPLNTQWLIIILDEKMRNWMKVNAISWGSIPHFHGICLVHLNLLMCLGLWSWRNPTDP